MRTDELIAAISADAGASPRRLGPAFVLALLLSALGAGLVFATVLHVRPDVAEALSTVRFPLKFILTTALAVAAAVLALRLARPGAEVAPGRLALAGALGLVALAVIVELLVLPSGLWATRLMGRNAVLCLASVPMLSAAPLAALLWALRRGAPERPSQLGAAAGILAGAIGATFYAAHCVDDSPLFVALWYSLAIALVAAIGAAAGGRLLRW